MFGRILLGYDGSEGAEKALEVALDIAKRYSAELHVISVATIPEYYELREELEVERARRYYGELLKHVREIAERIGMSIKTYLEFGKPSEEIVKKAKEIGADLIVLGVKTKHPFDRRVLGGTGDKVVDYAHCSVLIVR